jgi:hypothetical protein
MNDDADAKRWEGGQVLAVTSHICRLYDDDEPIPKARQWQVQSQSDRTKYYNIIEKPGGEVECDCPDFIHRGLVCKHIFACCISEVYIK